MNWMQVDIFTTTEGIEPLGAALLEMGVTGYSVRDAADFEAFLAGKHGHWDYIDDEVMKLRGAETALTVYFAENAQGNENLALLRQALERLRTLDAQSLWGRLEYTLGSVCEEDWSTAWKKYYTPVKVGERLVVCPSWEQYAPHAGEVIVKLDPGMAFGTGTHESTRLCMQLMERCIKPHARVLDVGCGSGILAVAALLLGAESAVGVDIDETAVQVAGENAALNGVAARSRFICGNLADKITGKYDLIFANIVADVILAFAPDIPAYLEKGGVFIASGIIDTRADEVLDGLKAQGFTVLEWCEAGGGVAFALVH